MTVGHQVTWTNGLGRRMHPGLLPQHTRVIPAITYNVTVCVRSLAIDTEGARCCPTYFQVEQQQENLRACAAKP